MRVLLTGASGYIGGLLLPRLQAQRHELRALARDPTRVHAEVPVIRGDLVTGEGLDRALDGVEVAYYLVHSMERAGNGEAPFQERERIAAERFAEAAAANGVKRIVYLGGLLGRDEDPETSPSRSRSSSRSRSRSSSRSRSRSRHLASREQVEHLLLEAVPDSVALRASIVIGARSRSFRLLVHLVERMRVLALPSWRRFRTQPIDERDVVEMLLAAADADIGGRSLDVGGPDVLSYGEMIERIADLMMVHRPALGLGVSVTAFTARFAAAIAGEDPDLVVPLMESLSGDLLPAEDHAAELLDVHLHSFDAAVEHALGEWEATERLAAR
ncbi:MAG TPA: NAD(P)H-binding protein [Solirubrobacteraceae bacterium]|nr:NAD(P)H-binding protein [Solirubrobacteraceae bacterium]